MDEKVVSVVMLPQLYTLLRQYQRLSYHPWTALAEFVDNSTESWFQNKDVMIANGIKGIRIDIDYDKVLDILTITDTAYGMELDDFKRAVILGSKPTQKTRNEYGFGLKTAACWFGSKWELHSTQLNSPNKYSVIVDIDKIEETKTNEIDIKSSDADLHEHWTKIIIHKVSKRMRDPGVKNKITQNLAFKYRRDIKAGAIKVYYNGELIEYEEPKILVYKGIEWKKDLNFSFDFDNKTYRVTGFVGIFAKGTTNSYQRSGFGLFMNDRTIIGGFGLNYKPEDIFTSDIKSPIAGKLFGELDLNDIPVNQAKDNFIWGDGLEDAFIKALKENIEDFIQVARKSYKDMKVEEEKIEFEDDVDNKDVDNVRVECQQNFHGESQNGNYSSSDNSKINKLNNNEDRLQSEFQYDINGSGTHTITIELDNTITDAHYLDKKNNCVLVNPDHIHYKNAPNKMFYLKQCVAFALVEDNLKIVYGNVNVTFSMFAKDFIKRYIEIFNSMRES